MNNDFLNAVMNNEEVGQFTTTQAQGARAAKIANLQSAGDIMNSISGDVLLTGGIVGKATGATDAALKSFQAASKSVGNSLSNTLQNARANVNNITNRVNTIRNPEPNGTAQDQIMDADPEEGVSGLTSDTAVNVASNVGTNVAEDVGTDLAAEGAADAVGAGLTASGIGAPLGAALILGTSLVTGIMGLKDLFDSHHVSPPKPDIASVPQAMFAPGVNN